MHSKSSDPDTVDEAVAALLGASRALVAVSARSIASAPDVTLPQFRMLVVLARTPSNLTELSRALDVAPSTALRMVDRLVDVDLVERAVSPDSRRETRVCLTDAGQQVVTTVTERRRRDLRSVVERLPVDELEHLSRAMALFAAAADDLWPLTRASLADRL